MNIYILIITLSFFFRSRFATDTVTPDTVITRRGLCYAWYITVTQEEL